MMLTHCKEEFGNVRSANITLAIIAIPILSIRSHLMAMTTIQNTLKAEFVINMYETLFTRDHEQNQITCSS